MRDLTSMSFQQCPPYLFGGRVAGWELGGNRAALEEVWSFPEWYMSLVTRMPGESALRAWGGSQVAGW